MIYDCFTFNNEKDILYLRLKHLWSYVDKFVIVEADKTHRGVPKQWNFDNIQHDFDWAKEKIIYVKINLNTDGLDLDYRGDSYNPNSPFMNLDAQQRNGIMNGLSEAVDSDIIMVSDLDEFPNHFAMNMIHDICDRYPIFSFGMRSFCYYMNVVQNKITWKGTVVGKKMFLTNPQDWRFIRWDINWEGSMGYHFSWIGKDSVKIKFKNTAHDEVYLYDDPNYIDSCFEMSGDGTFKDLFDRNGYESILYNIKEDPYYPKSIVDNIDIMPYLFYK